MIAKIKGFYLYTITLLVLSAVLQSCSSPVVSRPSSGMRPGGPQLEDFTGVKKKTALLTFFNESPYGGDELSVTATEELRRELSRTGHFIIDPMGSRIFGDSKRIYSAGGSNLYQLASEAKVAGINFVVYGRIVEARVRERTDEVGLIRKTQTYAEAILEVRVFDVNSAKEIFNGQSKGFANDDSHRFFMGDREEHLAHRREMLRYSTRVAARKFVPQLVSSTEKLEWVGRVARIIGNKIYINAGRQSGIHISDILKVMTEGQEIYDPDTGALIGVSQGEVKGTLEVIDYFGADGSIAIIHSGGSVHEGDFVMLY